MPARHAPNSTDIKEVVGTSLMLAAVPLLVLATAKGLFFAHFPLCTAQHGYSFRPRQSAHCRSPGSQVPSGITQTLTKILADRVLTLTEPDSG
jgi:hypothetical protein